MKFDKLRGFLERGIDTMNDAGRASDADGVSRSIELLFERTLVGGINVPAQVWGFEISTAEPGFNMINWVLDIMDEYIKIAEADFQKAVKSRPIHGFFGGLRLVVERKDAYQQLSLEGINKWRRVHKKVFTLCEQVWRLAQPSLCYDSPEGYMPTELEDEDDEDMNTQTVMSYSWRAIKESRYPSFHHHPLSIT